MVLKGNEIKLKLFTHIMIVAEQFGTEKMESFDFGRKANAHMIQ